MQSGTKQVPGPLASGVAEFCPILKRRAKNLHYNSTTSGHTGEIILAISRGKSCDDDLETEEAHQPGNAGIDDNRSGHGGFPFRP
jgi:hypothetical protein